MIMLLALRNTVPYINIFEEASCSGNARGFFVKINKKRRAICAYGRIFFYCDTAIDILLIRTYNIYNQLCNFAFCTI